MNTTTNTMQPHSLGRLVLLAFALIFMATASGCHHHHGSRGGDPNPPRAVKKGPPPHHQAPYHQSSPKRSWNR